MYEYEGMRRVSYEGGATFMPVCPKCGRFVKADAIIEVREGNGHLSGANSTCSKCGRVSMPFEGFIGDD